MIMVWRRYQNELIVGIALLLALFAWIYKHTEHTAIKTEDQYMRQETALSERIIGLQHIWGDKHIAQKLATFKNIIPSSKLQWRRAGKKVTATIHGLNASEMNQIVTKLLNLPIQIHQMKIVKKDHLYDMEFSCKW